jgi:hypothetical protein
VEQVRGNKRPSLKAHKNLVRWIILALLLLATELFAASFVVSLFLPGYHPQGNKSGIAVTFELKMFAMVILVCGVTSHLYHLTVALGFLHQKIRKQHLRSGEWAGWLYVITYLLVWLAAYPLAHWIES